MLVPKSKGMGNRINFFATFGGAKHVYNNQTLMLEKSTYYILDAQGNQLSMYEHQVDPVNSATMYYLTGRNIYGSSRLGTINDTLNMFIPDNLPSYGILGNRNYELSNHLGNVLMVINDIIYPLSADNTTIDSYEVGISNIFDYSPFGAPLDGRTIQNTFYQASASVDTVKQTVYALNETFDVASDWQATTSYSQITYPSGKMRVRNSSTTKRTIGAKKSFVTGEGLHEVSFDITSLPSLICEYQPPFPPIIISSNSDNTTTSGIGGNATLNVVIKNQNSVTITSGSYTTTGNFTNINFTAVEGDTYTLEFYINNACENTFFQVDDVFVSYEEVIITQTVYALEETFDVASDWQATTSYSQITYPSGKMRVRNSSTTKRTIGAKKNFVTGEGLHEVSFDITSLPSLICEYQPPFPPIGIGINSDSTTTSGIGGNATLNVVVKNQNSVTITSGSYTTTGNFANINFTAVEGDTYTIEFYINNACKNTFFQVDDVFVSHKEEVNIEAGSFIVSGDYRYGFNGMEKDDNVKGQGNSYDFGARIYDPRVGRWLSIDPLAGKYPNLSPYQFVYNSPLVFIDPDGKDGIGVIVKNQNGDGGTIFVTATYFVVRNKVEENGFNCDQILAIESLEQTLNEGNYTVTENIKYGGESLKGFDVKFVFNIIEVESLEEAQNSLNSMSINFPVEIDGREGMSLKSPNNLVGNYSPEEFSKLPGIKEIAKKHNSSPDKMFGATDADSKRIAVQNGVLVRGFTNKGTFESNILHEIFHTLGLGEIIDSYYKGVGKGLDTKLEKSDINDLIKSLIKQHKVSNGLDEPSKD